MKIIQNAINTFEGIKYEFLQIEGEEEEGPLLFDYISQNKLKVEMIVVGSQLNKSKLERYAVGSFSSYTLVNAKCPVTVVGASECVN